jgi:hypothetical protein
MCKSIFWAQRKFKEEGTQQKEWRSMLRHYKGNKKPPLV